VDTTHDGGLVYSIQRPSVTVPLGGSSATSEVAKNWHNSIATVAALGTVVFLQGSRRRLVLEEG
jgi:hypothetical protein